MRSLILANLQILNKYLYKIEIRWITNMPSHNHVHNILRLLDILSNFPFTTTEINRDY